MMFVLYKINTLCWIVIVLVHSETLFWLQANQALLSFLNDACLPEKEQKPIVL